MAELIFCQILEFYWKAKEGNSVAKMTSWMNANSYQWGPERLESSSGQREVSDTSTFVCTRTFTIKQLPLSHLLCYGTGRVRRCHRLWRMGT